MLKFNIQMFASTFFPADNAVNVCPVKPTITVTFGSAIFSAYDTEGTPFTAETLKEAFAFKKTDANGADVPCVMSIDTTNKIVTITPNEDLIEGQKYYVATIANKVFTAATTTEGAAAADWTADVVDGTDATMNNVAPATMGALSTDATAFKIDKSDENSVIVVYNSSEDTAYDVSILAPVEGSYGATDNDVKVEVGAGKSALISFESAKYVDNKQRLRLKAENAAVKYAFFNKK